MSANDHPPSKLPNDHVKEPVPAALKSLPPRKLARLLSDTERPFYVLDSKDRVRFANRTLSDVLGTNETSLIGLDCGRTIAADENPHPKIAGLLAIPESARSSFVSLSPIGYDIPSNSPWTGRLTVSLNSPIANGYMACFWLQADDPLVVQASKQVDWLAQAEIRNVLLDMRRTLSRLDGMHCLVGNSPFAQLARRQTQAAIAGNMSVCLYGPAGSGKAKLAKAIFEQRRKREGRLISEVKIVSIDCRLMDRSLMQDTLDLVRETESSYGSSKDHEPTALLLVSIDFLDADAFEPLTKFLEHKPSASIFATSQVRDLYNHHTSQAWQKLVADINVMSILIESLENRVEDIAPLAESILETCRDASFPPIRRSLSASTLQWLQAYPWPGNHRELSQSIHDAYRRSTTNTIEPNHFSLAIRTFASHVLRPAPIAPVNLDKALEDFERSVIQKAIDAFPRNRAAVARHLGISRTRLLRRLAQLGLEVSSASDEDGSVSTSPSIDFQHASEIPIFEEIEEESKNQHDLP